MDRHQFLRSPILPIEVLNDRSVNELLNGMRLTAFQGRKLAQVVDVWANMLKKNCVIWLGLAGALVPAGMRSVISYLIRRRMIDVLVSTGANLYHDCFEAQGQKHYIASSLEDDVILRRHRIDRMYDVLADDKRCYKMDNWIDEEISSHVVDNRPYCTREVLLLLGNILEEQDRGRHSILIDAYRSGVPIFCPGFADSSIAFSIMFANRRGRKIVVDSLRDLEEASRITEKAKMTGVVYLGGGVPKSFIQQTARVARAGIGGDKGHKFAVQITTDNPMWGGCGGSSLEQAQSWGEVATGAQMETCYADATIALPMVVHALADRFTRLKRNVPTFHFAPNSLEITYKSLTL